MAGRRRAGYRIDYTRQAVAQLRWLRQHDRAAYGRVADAIEARLRHEPTQADTHRFPTREGGEAAWELRVQPYRVYYDPDEAGRTVTVVGVARKPRETATPLPEE